MSVFPIDILMTGSALFTQLTEGQMIALGIDLGCFAMGLYLIKIVKKFDKVKSEKTVEPSTTTIVQESV